MQISLHTPFAKTTGTNEKIHEVFCFTDFLSGFSFRVRDGVGDGFRVRVRASVRAR